MRGFLLRQYSFGPWLGGVKSIFNSVTSYIGIVNFCLIAATAYHTTLGEPIRQHVPWMTFASFLAIIILLGLVAMTLEYKFMIPSQQEYSNIQRYKHKDLIKRDLRELKHSFKTEIAKLQAQLGAIEKDLEALSNESGPGDSPG